MENFVGKYKDCGSVIKKIKMFKGTIVENDYVFNPPPSFLKR